MNKNVLYRRFADALIQSNQDMFGVYQLMQTNYGEDVDIHVMNDKNEFTLIFQSKMDLAMNLDIIETTQQYDTLMNIVLWDFFKKCQGITELDDFMKKFQKNMKQRIMEVLENTEN